MSDNVFFFGSGFSKSIIPEYPTLYELSNHIKQMYENDNSAIGKHFNEEIPSQFYSNIEALLSYLLIDLPYKKADERLIDKALYKNITSKITKYFHELNSKFEINKNNKDIINRSDINRFANHILQNNYTSITLNYDILLDKILYFTKGDDYIHSNKLSTFYKIPIEHLSERGQGYYSMGAMFGSDKPHDIYKSLVPSIIKLHGSINWLYSEYVNNQIYFNDWIWSEFKSVDLEPYIIPPVLDKNSFYNNTILIALWQQAFDAIKNAKNIFIYGFSFPDTDYSIKFLFQSALKGREDYKIYVVNTNHNIQDLENKYNYIFGKEYCNYECCVEDNQLEKLMEMINEKKL